MARRPGRARRAVERPETAPDDDASAWARFLRRLTDAEAQDSAGDGPGVCARFLKRLSALCDGSDDDRSSGR